MDLPILVPVASTATVTATAPIRHLCPFADEADAGTVTITWMCNGATVELHSLAGFLGSFADTVISHEELTAVITEALRAAGDGITVTGVSVRFTTAGIDVRATHAVPDHAVHT